MKEYDSNLRFTSWFYDYLNIYIFGYVYVCIWVYICMYLGHDGF
jgi:hypothetical protein